MMKKVLILITILLYTIPLLTAKTVDQAGSQVLFGYVDSNAYLDFTLNQSIFPFDLLSPQVKPNMSNPLVFGLNIGSWSVISDADYFKVDISYTPLKNGSSEVDYILYFFTKGNHSFRQTIGANKTTTIDSDSIDKENNMYAIRNQNVYLALNMSNEEYEMLRSSNSSYNSGTYHSTITLTLTVGK